MQLFFVRHGESEANIIRQISNRGYVHGLTEKGREQASILAQKLGGQGIEHIFTSPLQRAVETAQILAAGLDVPYTITGALREFDCGIIEERRDAASWDLWQWVWDEWHIHKHFDSKIEGGESCLELRARLYPFVEAWIKDVRHGNAVMVGHGGLFGAVLPELMVNDMQVRTQIQDIGFPNTGYALAETSSDGLVCLEWCGILIDQSRAA